MLEFFYVQYYPERVFGLPSMLFQPIAGTFASALSHADDQIARQSAEVRVRRYFPVRLPGAR